MCSHLTVERLVPFIREEWRERGVKCGFMDDYSFLGKRVIYKKTVTKKYYKNILMSPKSSKILILRF